MPIPAIVGSALIGGGAGLLNTVVNAITGTDNVKRQLNANKELARYQNELNVQNWNMQNEYNLPKNQMQRFADAGLNPNLIYGQSNTAGDVGNVNVGSVDASLPLQDSVMNAVNLAMGLRQMHADIKQKDAQTDNVQAQTNLTTEKIISEQLQQDLQRWDAKLKEATEQGILTDNQLKKFEKDTFWQKWRLQRQNMQYNNMLLLANRQSVLSNMRLGWLKYRSDNENWQKDYNLRNSIFNHQKDVDTIRYAKDKFYKEEYYDNGIVPADGNWQSWLINGGLKLLKDFSAKIKDLFTW